MASRTRPSFNSGSRFTHIHLENWRNFAGADLNLQQRVFLVGPNASGKSNFLDVFRFLRDIASVGGGFQEAVSKREGVSRIRFLGARRPSSVVIRVALGDDLDSAMWEYELAFSQDNRQRAFIQVERVVRQGEIILERPNAEDEADPARLSQTYIEQVNVNQPFREVADFFTSVRYLHIVPQLIREPDRSVGKRNDPYGGDFLEQIARTPEKTSKSRLKRIEEALQVALPQLTNLEMWRDERGTPHLRGRYQSWRPNAGWQSENQFSDGTLRLLGLLWAFLEGKGPLLLEEPELSLHSAVVRFVPQIMARAQRGAGRQVLISTHSSDILSDTGIGLDETLLLEPTTNGTAIHLASDFDEIKILLNNGLSLAEAVIPRTSPAKAQQLAQQLALFGDPNQ